MTQGGALRGDVICKYIYHASYTSCMESDQESTGGMDLGICSYESCKKGVKKSINGKVVGGGGTYPGEVYFAVSGG